MYTDNNNFSVRNVILKFLFVALFIFILIWLFPLKSDLKKAISSNDKNNKTEEKSTNEFSILYDRIFYENLLIMKDAAKEYFTLERLPQKEGDKVKITLGEMISKKMILEFKDKNGKTCDKTKSYVEVTKNANEYVMKVNLKCGEEENYIITYLGCYDYCKNTVCEKKNAVKVYKAATKTTPVKQATKKQVVKRTSTKEVKKSIKETKITDIIIIKRGYYCKLINGKYYDNNGKVVNKEAFEKSCKTPVPTPEEPKKEYEYEYVKDTEGEIKYSEWSDWSFTKITPSSTIEVQAKDVKYRKLLGYNVKTEDDLSKPITAMKDVVVGSKTVTSCEKYNYTQTVTGYNYQYIGTFKYTSAPQETEAYHYKRVAGDYNWYCDGECKAGTVLVYEKYQKVPQTTGSYSCAKYNTEKTVYTTKQLVVTGYEKKQTKEPVYDYYTKTQYRYRTKTKTTGKHLSVWSFYNDTYYLNQGYRYGNGVREKTTK